MNAFNFILILGLLSVEVCYSADPLSAQSCHTQFLAPPLLFPIVEGTKIEDLDGVEQGSEIYYLGGENSGRVYRIVSGQGSHLVKQYNDSQEAKEEFRLDGLRFNYLKGLGLNQAKLPVFLNPPDLQRLRFQMEDVRGTPANMLWKTPDLGPRVQESYNLLIDEIREHIATNSPGFAYDLYLRDGMPVLRFTAYIEGKRTTLLIRPENAIVTTNGIVLIDPH